MTVLIAHAAADAAVAESLKEGLAQLGLFNVRLESSEQGLLPVGSQDVLVAFWSKHSPFDPFRLRYEKRALDAWADGRLVLVRLDAHFTPVGLRDLPYVDAIFETQRSLIAWREVARRVQELTRPKPAPQAPAPAADAPAAPPQVMRPPAAPGATGRGDAGPVDAKTEGYGVGSASGGFWSRLFGRRRASKEEAAASESRSAPAHDERARAITMPESEPAPTSAEEAGPAPNAVFVSYARADAAVVLPVCEGVRQAGQPLWLDHEGIGAGDGWAGEIVRAIRTVRGVAVMCSKAAFESDHVKREVYLADRYKKRLLPVLIDDTPMPDDFEYFFAGVQWLDLDDVPEGERGTAVAKAFGS